MLYFTLVKHKKCQSFRGSAPDPAGGAHSAPPDPLAGKNGLTALAPIRLGGPNKIWGLRYQPTYPPKFFLSEALTVP